MDDVVPYLISIGIGMVLGVIIGAQQADTTVIRECASKGESRLWGPTIIECAVKKESK